MAGAPRGMDAIVTWIGKRATVLCRVVAWLVAALVTAPFVYHMARHSPAFLSFLEDDHFYYSIVADRLVSSGKLTYDGAIPTNGFHPLWFAVLVVLRAVAGGLNHVFYALLVVVFFASMIVTYELSSALARILGAGTVVAPAVGLVFSAKNDIVLSSGMETSVDIPLLLLLLVAIARAEPVTPRRAARLGLLASVAVLARLDIALVVPIVACGWLLFARPSRPTFMRAALGFCAGGIALPIYAAVNLVVFGTLLPVSGLAKQLIKRFGFNFGYLRSIASYTIYGYAAGLTLVAGTVALLVWLRERGREPPERAGAPFAGAVALGFAAVFFLANALSGWMYFGWYLYPLVPALVAALTFVGLAARSRIPPAWRPRVAAGFVAGSAVVAGWQGAAYGATHGPLWRVEDSGLLDVSIELAKVMRERPGVYGMGAVAGFVTYELHQPLVQLEGLVEDRAMVDHIRNEDDLGAVLAQYHVDYLVVTLARTRLEQRGGCYVVTQPNSEWAGTRVAEMRGAICREPVARFSTRSRARPWSIFSSLDTYVFDVRGATWKPVPAGAAPAAPDPPPEPGSAVAQVRDRPYGLYVPRSYRSDAPAPLLVVLHGVGGRAADMIDLFDLPRLSEEHGFVYAFPDGTRDRHGNRFWNATDACCDFDDSGVDDVRYLGAVLDDVEAHYAIDPRRVYFAGFSNGGYMAHRVACDMADRVAAVVSVSGAMWMDAAKCRPSEPVSVLEVHADEDEIVHYEGKEFEMGGRTRWIPSAHATVATWAQRDGCSAPLEPYGEPVDWDGAVPGPETTRARYGRCAADVELWTVHGGRHMPGSGASLPSLTWSFLEAHPKAPSSRADRGP